MTLYTLAREAVYEEDIKKSRFLALARPVDSAAQALQFFQERGYPEATHNCWAYRIGDDYRFNDDGEPGGTAGRPILQAIEGQQCDRVAVLVVRWFGGVKLGTGGLVRAYGGAAAQCLRLAERKEIIPLSRRRCRCAFADMARVQSRFEHYQVQLVQESFDGRGVDWTLDIPSIHLREFEQVLINMTRGQGEIGPPDGDPVASS